MGGGLCARPLAGKENQINEERDDEY